MKTRKRIFLFSGALLLTRFGARPFTPAMDDTAVDDLATYKRP